MFVDLGSKVVLQSFLNLISGTNKLRPPEQLFQTQSCNRNYEKHQFLTVLDFSIHFRQQQGRTSL